MITYLDAGEALHVHLVNECQTYQLQAAIFHEALLNCVPPSDGTANTLLNYFPLSYLCLQWSIALITVPFPDQISLPIRETKKKPSHVPIMSRPTEREFRSPSVSYSLCKNYSNACHWNVDALCCYKLQTKCCSLNVLRLLFYPYWLLILIELNPASYEERRAKFNSRTWRSHPTSQLYRPST